jgi:frataxin-like iron-binding protein CyaY
MNHSVDLLQRAALTTQLDHFFVALQAALAALWLSSLLAGLVNFQRSSGFGLWWRKNCELHLVAAFFQGTLDGPDRFQKR